MLAFLNEFTSCNLCTVYLKMFCNILVVFLLLNLNSQVEKQYEDFSVTLNFRYSNSKVVLNTINGHFS